MESSANAEDTEISELLERQEFFTEENMRREITVTQESAVPKLKTLNIS
jgi:hypothetical protein